jgi:putative hydrolase of HD superfamily
MAKPDIERALTFTKLLHAFQSVERIAHAPGLTRQENDVEHSYLLTMLCWYLSDSLKLGLNTSKILEYGLAHDLVETYAGDTYIWDTEALKTKHVREEKARIQIEGEFPEFPDLHATIQRYEKQSDEESVFVRAVDKLLPVLTNYLQDGHTWKEMAVPHEDLYANKREKIADQKGVRELLEQMIELIGDDWQKYFES